MNDSVKVPTNSEWKQIPGSPFEVITYPHEQIGTLHLRWNEGYADRWFEEILDRHDGLIKWLVEHG